MRIIQRGRPQTSTPNPRSAAPRRPARSALVTLAVALVTAAPAAATSMVSYVHVATADTITGLNDELTELDNPLLDDNPDARVLVTQNWNPPGSSGVYNDHFVGVVYYADFSGGGTWYIRNQDNAAIPVGAAFNVLILGPDTLSFVHLTAENNISGRATSLSPIDYDCLLCPAGTLLLYSHTQTVYGIDGGAFAHHSSILGRDTIVTESRTPGFIEPMPAGVLFNVLVADSPGVATSPGWAFRHVATAGNSAFNWTYLSHPELDGDPAAVFFVSRAGPALVNSPHELGLWYTGSGEWTIFFQDTETMVFDSYYNVYIPPIMADGLEGGDLSWWSDSVGVPRGATGTTTAVVPPGAELRDLEPRFNAVRAGR